MSDSLHCSICLVEEKMDGCHCVTLSCQHRFHLQCISDWLHVQQCCPMCRHDIIHECKREEEGGNTLQNDQCVNFVQVLNRFCAFTLLSVYVVLLYRMAYLWFLEPRCISCVYATGLKSFELLIWNTMVVFLHGCYDFINILALRQHEWV